MLGVSDELQAIDPLGNYIGKPVRTVDLPVIRKKCTGKTTKTLTREQDAYLFNKLFL